MRPQSFRVFLTTAIATSLLAGAAHAEFPYKPKLGINPNDPDNEMIEVGTGARHQLGSNEAEILLNVSFGGVGIRDSGEFMLWYVARVNTQVGFGVDARNITSFDIDVRPMGLSIGEPNFERLGVDILPIDINRDIRMGHEWGMKVRAVEARMGWSFPHLDDHAAFLASVAVEALGYKMVDYVEAQGGDFHGAEILGARAELAERFFINENFVITAAVGGEADFALGGANDQFALQSDIRSYAALRFNIGQFMEVFTQAGVRYSGDTGNDNFVTVGEVLGGLRFYF